MRDCLSLFNEVVEIMHHDYAGVMNNRFTCNGIEPDVYLSWSPRQIEEDLDLAEALKILGHIKETGEGAK